MTQSTTPHVHTPQELAAEHKRYMQVFLYLGVLTVAEIGVVYLPIAKAAIVFMLVALAGTKAAMVALYYMHLAIEKRTLMYIAMTPMILCGFLLFMLFPDHGHPTRTRTQIAPPAADAAHH